MNGKEWTKNDTQYLIDNHHLSVKELSYNMSRTMGSIYGQRQKLHLLNKSISKLYTQLNVQQQQIFDGLMISDGSIELEYRNPRFKLGSITKSLIDKTMELLPFKWGKTYVCPAHYHHNMNHKTSYLLRSLKDTGLLKEYYRWYPNGIKIVPIDIQLSPLLVKYWFYGDGSTCLNKKYPNNIQLRLYTNGFTYSECVLLKNRFDKINMDFKIVKSKAPTTITNIGRGYELSLNKQESVYNFFNYIGYCDIEEFKYKWKFYN